MAGEVELIKTNLYVAAFPAAVDHEVLLAKTNLYVAAFPAAVDHEVLLAKTNLYVGTIEDSNEVYLGKTNLYIAAGDADYNEFVTVPFVDNSDDSELFPIGVRSPAEGEARIVATEIERNPYRAHMSDDPVEVARDLKEQQRVLRRQHNMTQAGDSTFDYGLLYKSYPNQEFNLGSLGRFFSEELGIVVARFVQFKDMVEHPWQGQPVGRLKFNNTLVDWVVTNDIEKSDPDLVLGFTSCTDVPPDDYYGWAVVSGANPAAIRVISQRVPNQADAYTWLETGGISLDKSGTILGRRWGTTQNIGVPEGALFIGIEGRSDADLEAFIRDRLAEDLALLQTVKDGVDALNAWKTTVTTTLASLAAMDQTLLERIQKEELVRGREIQGIRNSTQIIDVDGKILAATIELRNEFGAADQPIFARADQAYQLAESVQLQLQALDLSGLDGISGIAEAIATVDAKFGGLSFDTTSLVDGQIFNAVMYPGVGGADDYFVMEPLDYTLNNLTDVDVTLLAAGTSPVWDGTDYIFLELARASNSIIGADQIEILGGGDLGDPVTTIGHADSGVTADTYGDATHYPVITVDAQGHITGVTVEEVTGGGGGIPEAPIDGKLYGRYNGTWAEIDAGIVIPIVGPSALVNAASVGWFIDPTDISSLFQDDAGSTAVTADADPIGKINDLSTHAWHFTQATSGFRPKYKILSGVACIEFDGTDDWISSSGLLYNAGDVTLVVAVYGPSEYDMMVYSEASTSSSNPLWNPLLNDGPGISGFMRSDSNSTRYNQGQTDTPEAAFNSAWHVATVRETATLTQRRVDRGSWTDFAYTRSGTLTPTFGTLGALRRSTISNHLQGYIGRAVILSEGVSDTDLADIENWVASPYGVSLP